MYTLYILFILFCTLALVTLLSTLILPEEKAIKVVSWSIANAFVAMVIVIISAIINSL
jgi:hypothetical protein